VTCKRLYDLFSADDGESRETVKPVSMEEPSGGLGPLMAMVNPRAILVALVSRR